MLRAGNLERLLVELIPIQQPLSTLYTSHDTFDSPMIYSVEVLGISTVH